MGSAPLYVSMAILGGAAGGLFFWGLWLTLAIARGRDSKALLVAASFLIRMAFIAGVALIALNLSDAYGLLAFMGGVLLSRIVATRSVRSSYD